VNPIWIWGVALGCYGLFTLWYHSWRGALEPAEIETHLERFSQFPDATPERLAVVRAFLEKDDGGEFFMLNLLRANPEPVAIGDEPPAPAREVLRRYTGYFMPHLFRRAGHPAFVGPAAGGYVEHWGVEPNPGWTFAGIIRYRSRRDMLELATDPRFASAHEYKLAALANTLAFPVAPAVQLVGPRVWVGLVLALLAALVQLAFGAGGR